MPPDHSVELNESASYEISSDVPTSCIPIRRNHELPDWAKFADTLQNFSTGLCSPTEPRHG
jgi:hypothetical protein